MFDLSDCQGAGALDDLTVQRLQQDLDVSIAIKPKARQTNKSVIIKAQERNASAIYRARSLLLGLEEEPIKAAIPDTYNIQAVSPTSGLSKFQMEYDAVMLFFYPLSAHALAPS